MARSDKSFHLPCLMAACNPERYADVTENCKTLTGFNNIAVVIQHTIKCHLHYCRNCKAKLTDGETVKSKKNYMSQNSLPAHKSCLYRPWGDGVERLIPEILTEAQEQVLLRWDRKTEIRRLQDRPGVDDKVLWQELYLSLHQKPPGKMGASWSYYMPRHQAEHKEREYQLVIDDLKRALATKQQFIDNLPLATEKQKHTAVPPQRSRLDIELSHIDHRNSITNTEMGDDDMPDPLQGADYELVPTTQVFVNPKDTMMHCDPAEDFQDQLREDLEKMASWPVPDSGFGSGGYVELDGAESSHEGSIEAMF